MSVDPSVIALWVLIVGFSVAVIFLLVRWCKSAVCDVEMEQIVDAVMELSMTRGTTGGLIKRIDENRELLELLIGKRSSEAVAQVVDGLDGSVYRMGAAFAAAGR